MNGSQSVIVQLIFICRLQSHWPTLCSLIGRLFIWSNVCRLNGIANVSGRQQKDMESRAWIMFLAQTVPITENAAMTSQFACCITAICK